MIAARRFLVDERAARPAVAATATTTWGYLALATDGATASRYVNGQMVVSTSIDGLPGGNNFTPINLGADVNSVSSNPFWETRRSRLRVPRCPKRAPNDPQRDDATMISRR